jgi:protein SCO1/2
MFNACVARLRSRAATAALLAALLVAAASGCGGTSSHEATAGSGHGLQGLVVTPPKPAPALALRDYTGEPVSLAALRGKAVLVTFVYTHCPDVCPLMISNLANAQRQLGTAASAVRILAVTVDPRGDTPAAVRKFLLDRDAIGRIQYLLGSDRQLRRTWTAWDVAVQQGAGKQPVAGHSAIVYGITASGRMAVVYPSNFTPAQVVHDVPLLARS